LATVKAQTLLIHRESGKESARIQAGASCPPPLTAADLTESESAPLDMPSTHKKVIVRKHDRDSISGYVAPANFVVEGKLELLNTSGNVVAIDLREIKAVYFVREFSDTDLMLRKTFTTRPRTEGLWVRMKFKDSEVIEGILPNDLTQNPNEGFLMNPPDLRSNTQRVFVPREALASLTVLAVIGSANRRRRGGQPDTRQVTLFES
jgi:hypothetical protein